MNQLGASTAILQQTIWVAAAAVLTIGFGGSARAQGIDRIYRQNGLDSGKITEVTALGVKLIKGGVESSIPAEDIKYVYLAGEPAALNTARAALQAGKAQEALNSLEGISAAEIERQEILAELDFYAALAKARLALAGQGDADAAAADFRQFMSKRTTSFHLPEAVERLGELLASAGKFADARTEYAKLGRAKSPYYQLRAAWLTGRAWQDEGDHAKAISEFDKVLAASGEGPIESLKTAASLDAAVSQAATGKNADATATIAALIASAKADDDQLLARAYNALGDCYLKSGDSRGALFAFLHVDLLYPQVADAHAKALHELVPLWRTTGHVDRSQEAAAELAEKYPGSRWAKEK